MSTAPVYKKLSDSKLRECLKCSKEFLSAVDETIDRIPYNASDSIKQKILRFLFMDARSAAYDICVLAESLLTNESHINSRSIEAANRLIWENAIDYFYIYESDDTVAEQRWSFFDRMNSIGQSQKDKEKAFKKKYKVTDRGDRWSGKSRQKKMNQGIYKHGMNKSRADLIKTIFENFNEEVHGNRDIELYWDFSKRHVHKEVSRIQVSIGLLSVMLFSFLSESYCKFTGRGSEANQFAFYEQNVHKLLSKTPVENTQ